VELDAWLAPFAAQGKMRLAAAFCSLDTEVQVLFLADSLTIHDARSEAIPAPAKDVPRMTTSDSFFVLDAPRAEEREVPPFALVDALYTADLHEAFRLLMAAKWEMPSPLEEEARRFRVARLEELGFPERERALRIFAPPPTRPVGRNEVAPVGTTTLPAPYAQPLAEGSLLVRALAHIGEAALLATIESEIAHLISSAVVAYGETPRGVSHVTEIATRVRDTLCLGLEVQLSPGGELRPPDTEATAADAANLLRQWTTRDLFRHGHRAVVELRKAAAALAADPIVAHWLEHVESEADDYSEDRADRQMMRALLADPPLWAGYDRTAPERRKAFGSRRELAEAEQRIDAIAGRLL
jgi:hypothetical protein